MGGGDSAADTLVETDSTLSTSGTLTVNDADLSDSVTPTVTGVVLGGTTGGLVSGDVLGMLTVGPGSIAANAGDVNNLAWSFNSGAQAFDFLNNGESLTLTYTVRATDDSSAFDDQTVVVTINGTNDNDPPVITVGGGDSAAAAIAETNTTLTGSGTLTVTDVDLGDSVTPTVTGVVLGGTTGGLVSGDVLAMLSVGPGSIAADPGDTNNLAWTFNSGAQAFDFLDDGESLTLTYTVRATDGSSAFDDQTVVITINGTNDAPLITVGGGDAASAAIAETNTTLTSAGTLTVTDADLSDSVSPTVTGVVLGGTTGGLVSGDVLSMLSVGPGSIAANPTDTSNLVWTFNSGAQAFNFLDDGESLTLTYTVRATDDSGAFDDQTVVITINGTNDAPLITVGGGDIAADTLVETNTTLSSSGTLTVNDADLSDSVTPTVTGVVLGGTTGGLVSGDVLAMLGVGPGSIAANAGDASNLNWAFNSGAQAFDFLDDGESLTLTYTVRATDDSSTFDDQTVVITINGTNDAPLITVGGGDAASAAIAETNTTLTGSGTLTVTDADLSDSVTPTVSGVVLGGTTGGLVSGDVLAMLSVGPGSIAANAGDVNNLAWSFNSGAQAFDFLDDGESLTLTYTVRATDDSAAFDDQTVVITINGTNDAPLITVGGGDSASKTLVETNTTLSSSGTLTVNDADLSDSVTPTVTGVVLGGTTGGLVSGDVLAMLGVGPGSIAANAGDVNNLSWTFDSGAQAFDFLDDGESLTLTYTVRATDDSAVFDDQTVVITINGTNDAPLITVGGGDAASAAIAETNTTLTSSGTLTVTDADLSDSVTPTVTGVVLGGTTGGLVSGDVLAMLSVGPGSIAANAGDVNNLAWSFNSGAQAFDFLAVGESLTLTYTVRATDDSAATGDRTVVITITGSNDAPVLDAAKSPALLDVDEDAGAPSVLDGTAVSDLVDRATPSGEVDNVTDADSSNPLGIAVTAADNSNGTWYYTTDGGNNWNLLGVPSDGAARLLAADGNSTRLYFQANANFNGTLANAITFRAWDQSTGSNGALANTVPNGNQTAFSVDTDTASLVVNAVNDPPVLVSTGTMVLPNVVQYDTDPAGMRVSDLIATAGDPISDVDVGAVEGLAITAADNANGAWQYSTDGGASWFDVGPVSNSLARVLGVGVNDRIRFVPSPGFTGNATIAFLAWDQSDLLASGTGNVDTTGAGSGNSPFSAATDVARVYVEPLQVLMWLSTSGDVTGSGVAGLPNWGQASVLTLGDPGLSLGTGSTAGRTAVQADFDNFGTDVDIVGLHRTNTALTMTGTGIDGGSIDLLVGDVLFVTADAETLTTGAGSPPAGWANNINTAAGSVYAFRPVSSNDYSSGYFRLVMADPGVNTTHEIALVEKPTSVGGTVLAAGDLLFTQTGSIQKNNVYWYQTGSDSTTMLIDGADINIPGGGGGASIDSLDLIQGTFSAGGVSFQAGDLLLGFEKQVNGVGTGGNTVNAYAQDVVGLRFSSNSIGVSTAVVTMAQTVFDGDGSAGFDTPNENLDAVAMLIQGAGSNLPPTVTLPGGALNYTEGDGAKLVDTGATVTDADSPDLNTGALRIELTAGGTSNDRLAIRNQGTGSGEIGVSGSDVTFEGTVIGSFYGGTDGHTPLMVNFNAFATPAAAQALLQNITYENVSNNPLATPRTLRVLLSDGDNTTSAPVTKAINVTNVNDPPVAADDAYVTNEDTPLVVGPSSANLDDWFALNEGGGQTVGSTGTQGSSGTLGTTGAVEGSDPSWVTGHVGGAGLSFDQPGDVVVTDSTALKTASTFTLSVWFQADVTTGAHHLLWQGYAGGNGYGNGGSTSPATSEMSLSIGSYNVADNNKIVFFLGYDVPVNGADSIFIVSDSDFTDTGNWHHVAVTVADIGGGVMRASLYVDGQLEGTDTGTENDRSVWQPLRIGASGNGSRSFLGDMDEVRIYANELSAGQVRAIAQSGVLTNDTDSDSPLVQVKTPVVSGPTNGTLSINADGSFVYTPNADFSGVDSFSYLANDGTDDSNVPATVTITVNPVNDAPTLSATALDPTFAEAAGLGTQAAAVNLFSSAAASTHEAGQTISGITFTVSGLLDGADELIEVDGTTIALGANSAGTTTGNGLSYSATVSGGTATIVLSGGTLSAAAAQSLVDGITYQNTDADDPSAGNRVVTLTQIIDSGGTSNGGVNTTALAIASTVTVTAINDAPTLTASALDPTFTEAAGLGAQAAAVAVFGSAAASAIEAGQTISGLTFTVSGLLDGANEVIVVDGSTVALGANSSGTTSGNGLTYNVTVGGGMFAPEFFLKHFGVVIDEVIRHSQNAL